MTHSIAVIALLALAVGLYDRAVDAPLFFDDQTTVVSNPVIQTLYPLSKFFTGTRPLTRLSFALNYARAGSEPREYHVVNIALHAINGVLVYALFNRALHTPALMARYAAAGPAIAVAGAALFVAHPLQSETVAYISSRSEALAALFYLLTVLLYATGATTTRRVVRYASGAALPLTCAAALASKQMAATLPAALLLYDWCFLAQGNWRRMRARWPLLVLPLLPFAIGVPFLLYRSLSAPTAGFAFEGFTAWEYLLTQFGVVLHYLRLTVVPVGLCLDTEWPLARSPWTPGVLLPLGILSALVVCAVSVVRRQPLVTFTVLWTLLVLAPTSSVIPVADLVAERRMYLALVGPAFLAAAWAWELAHRAARRWGRSDTVGVLTHVLLVLIALSSLSVLTLARVRVWLDTVTLYEDVVAKAPTNPRARLNLGTAYLFRGRLDAAAAELEEAQRLFTLGQSVHADHAVGVKIHLTLCNLLYQRQQLQEATLHCQQALRFGGHSTMVQPVADLYLGHIAVAQQQWSTAIAHYKRTLRHAPPGVRMHTLLHMARTYLISGQVDLARRSLEAVLIQDPGNQEAAGMLRALDNLPAAR